MIRYPWDLYHPSNPNSKSLHYKTTPRVLYSQVQYLIYDPTIPYYSKRLKNVSNNFELSWLRGLIPQIMERYVFVPKSTYLCHSLHRMRKIKIEETVKTYVLFWKKFLRVFKFLVLNYMVHVIASLIFLRLFNLDFIWRWASEHRKTKDVWWKWWIP